MKKCKHIWTASMFTFGNRDFFIKCLLCKEEKIIKQKRA